MSGHDVTRQGECFIANDDTARLGDGLQPCRQIGLCANDRVVHSIRAPEIADVAITRVDAHPRLERVLDSRGPPFRVEFKGRRCMRQAIRTHAWASALSPFVSGSPKKISIASPMNLSIVPPCSWVIADISVKYSLSN